MKTQGVFAAAEPDIFQVKVPLPYPLRWVNSYVFRGEDGLTVMDPGLHTEEAEALWRHAANELGFGWRDIRRIVLTHHHPDHYGLAGWLQELSGAEVWLSEAGYRQAEMMWQNGCPFTDELHALFLLHGMDKETAGQLIPHLNGFVRDVSPQPEVRFLPVGEPFFLGDFRYETVLTAGHAAGHVSFYDKLSGRIFCGDHVLPRISPNVSLVPGVDEDPLASYLTGLEELSLYAVTAAYPGHREPFASFSARCRELIAHHEQRIAAMLEHLAGGSLTAWELCRRMFGTRLSIHQLRFAMAETIAHLVYMEKRDMVAANNRDGVLRYVSGNASR